LALGAQDKLVILT